MPQGFSRKPKIAKIEKLPLSATHIESDCSGKRKLFVLVATEPCSKIARVIECSYQTGQLIGRQQHFDGAGLSRCPLDQSLLVQS